jgi:hypothetical protein
MPNPGSSRPALFSGYGFLNDSILSFWCGHGAFYFNIYGDDEITLDEENVDLIDVYAALSMAADGARQLATDCMLLGSLDLGDRIEVEDATHRIVWGVTFTEAIAVRTFT